MIVGDDDGVDGGQIFEADARGYEPPRAREAHGAGALTPVRIRENVQPVDLDQERRVSDPGDGGGLLVRPQLVAVVLDHEEGLASRARGGAQGVARALQQRVSVMGIDVAEPGAQMVRGHRRLWRGGIGVDPVGNGEAQNDQRTEGDHVVAHCDSLKLLRRRCWHPDRDVSRKKRGGDGTPTSAR